MDTLTALCGLALTVTFNEGAPRDRFVIENLSSENWSIATMAVQLDTSNGKLVFDTEAGGKGVEVFQLFKVEKGEALLQDASLPGDGDDRLSLTFTQFVTSESFEFSIDVDDQLDNSELGQIRVAGGEMQGALIRADMTDGNGKVQSVEAQFSDKNRAEYFAGPCVADVQ